MVLLFAAAALYFFVNNIFGNLFYGVLKQFIESRTGVMEAELISRLSQSSFDIFFSIGVVWLLYRYIHNQISASFSAKRDEDRQKLWDLHAEGVALRNDGIRTRQLAAWDSKFKDWHSRAVKQAGVISMDLKRSLETMDKMPIENVDVPMPEHSTNVSINSEMLRRIKQYLDTH